ncbi:MAG TPA: phosphatase PAP2 family protein [Draconibacterium sp.]|nr:phosphatase PAP2 family protein [Draconibacterium sp.]
MSFLQSILEQDKELFLYLNGFHSDFWDTIMMLVTRQETWIPLFIVIIYFFIRNYRLKAVIILLGVALVILGADQLAGLLKVSVQRLRPGHDPSISELVHNVMGKGGLYSFVSAHAANSVALLVFTSRIFKRRSFYFLMLTWTLLFIYSRIYVGVHYPLDLLCGALLGWGVGYSVFKLMMFIENHFFYTRSPKIEKTSLSAEQSGIIWIVYLVLIATMFIISYLLHHFNIL